MKTEICDKCNEYKQIQMIFSSPLVLGWSQKLCKPCGIIHIQELLDRFKKNPFAHGSKMERRYQNYLKELTNQENENESKIE